MGKYADEAASFARSANDFVNSLNNIIAQSNSIDHILDDNRSSEDFVTGNLLSRNGDIRQRVRDIKNRVDNIITSLRFEAEQLDKKEEEDRQRRLSEQEDETLANDE